MFQWKRGITLAVVLALCTALSIGGTMAYFTDTVEVKNQIVEAGNLDIELYQGTVAEENKVKVDSKIFVEPERWEPGAVAWAKLIVANVGDLAFHYDMKLNIAEENTVVLADGTATDYKLSDVLQVAFVKDIPEGSTRDQVLALAENAGYQSGLTSFAYSSSIKPVEGQSYAAENLGLIVYWPDHGSEIDNNYNVNNGKTTSDNEPLHIDLGITAEAYQMAYERDTIGPDYDADAYPGEYVVVDTAEELQDVFDRMNKGELPKAIVELAGDISTTQLEITKGELTLNLNGNELSTPSDDKVSDTVLKVTSPEAHLIIKGEGDVMAYHTSGTNMAVWAHEGGRVDIYGGNFANFEVGEESDFIYVNQGYGAINIYGGTFTSAQPRRTLNQRNTNDVGRIVVYGGTFTNFDPLTQKDDWPQNHESGSWVAAGYTTVHEVVDGKDVYTVVPKTGEVQKTVDTEDEILYFVEKLNKGELTNVTLTLDKDIETPKGVYVEKGELTIDLNGHDIVTPAGNQESMAVITAWSDDAHVIVKGEGNVVANHIAPNDTNLAVWARNGGHIDIYGGNYSNVMPGEYDFVYVSYPGGTINIYGGTFTGANPARTLNQTNNTEVGRIVVYGGTFVEFNPYSKDDWPQHETESGTWVATGYTVEHEVVDGKNIYTVVAK